MMQAIFWLIRQLLSCYQRSIIGIQPVLRDHVRGLRKSATTW
jgi:hypothetical protein